jgi:glycosyltransferase involved in cell wall biosynthesis
MYNDSEHLNKWLDSFRRQSVLPDEIIFVDGGSSDGSPHVVEKAMHDLGINYKVIVDNRLNLKHHVGPIGAARNVGIRMASFEHIVCTDMGVIFSDDWFEGMRKAFFKSSLVKGRYYTVTNEESRYDFGRCFTPSNSKYLSSKFLPSSRSVGFTKTIWSTVGGYPENSYTAEDTLFSLRCSEFGDYAPVDFGFVEWILPKDEELAGKIQNYAKGDKIQGLFFGKYIIKAVLWRLTVGSRRFIWKNETKGYWDK